MRRSLLVLGLCAVSLPPAQHAAAGVVTSSGPVRGDVLALAFSGDALVIARRPEGRAVRIELRRPGRPAKLLLLTGAKDADASVTLAASREAVAFGLSEDAGDVGARSRVWVGPPVGPLREVAVCSRGFLLPAVAVEGGRVAWADGGCAGPTGRSAEIGPASVGVGSVDPTVPIRRVPIPRDALAGGLALQGEGGLVGVLRPTFFGLTTDVRPFGPDGLGEPREREPAGFLLPVGLLADGTAALARMSLDDEAGDGEPEDLPRCTAETVVLAPGATTRRALQSGGCLDVGDDLPGDAGATVAGERIVSRVGSDDDDEGDGDGPSSVAITSVRPDGNDLKTIVSGSHRRPLGLAADGARVAWRQLRCAGGEALVVADGPVPALKACTLRVVTRRARVRAGRAALRVRCALGCEGVVVDDTQCGPERLRRFTLPPGTSRLHVRVPGRSRRRGRLLLRFEVNGGPTRTAVVRLRR